MTLFSSPDFWLWTGISAAWLLSLLIARASGKRANRLRILPPRDAPRHAFEVQDKHDPMQGAVPETVLVRGKPVTLPAKNPTSSPAPPPKKAAPPAPSKPIVKEGAVPHECCAGTPLPRLETGDEFEFRGNWLCPEVNFVAPPNLTIEGKPIVQDGVYYDCPPGQEWHRRAYAYFKQGRRWKRRYYRDGRIFAGPNVDDWVASGRLVPLDPQPVFPGDGR